MADTSQDIVKETDLGPRKIGNAKLIYKTVLGIIGGVAGTLVIFIVMFLSQTLFPSIFQNAFAAETAGINPILLYVVLAMVFLTTMIGNLISIILVYIADRDKYTKLTTNLIQGFIFNLLIFVFSIPLYLIIQGSNVSALLYVVGIHFLLSSFITSLMMEILVVSRYTLVGLYGNTFSILAALVINLVLFSLAGGDTQKAILLFLTMPIIWGSIGFFGSITEMIYRWFYDTYGIDFLSKEAQYEEEGRGEETGEER